MALLRETDCCAARLAWRARGQDDAPDDRLGRADVMVQPVFQCRTDGAVDNLGQLRVVQAVLGLSLELRVNQEDAEHTGEPFADVVRSEGHALRRQVVRLDEIADRLAQAGTKTGLVGAAGAGRDAVDVAAEPLVSRLGPP